MNKHWTLSNTRILKRKQQLSRIIEQLPPIDEVFKKDVEVVMRGKEEGCNIEGRTCLPQKI